MLNSNVRTAAAVAVAKGKLISSLFKMHPSTHASTSSSCINKNDVDHGDIYEDDEDKAITLSKSSAGSFTDDQLWRQIMDQSQLGTLITVGATRISGYLPTPVSWWI